MASGWELFAGWNQLCDKMIGTFSSIPGPGRGEVLEVEVIANDQWFNQSSLVMQPFINNGVQRASVVSVHIRVRAGGTPREGVEDSQPWPPSIQYPALCIASIWLFICILYNAFHNKPEFCELLQKILETEKGVAGTSQLYSHWEGPRMCHWLLTWGQRYGTEPWGWELHSNSGETVLELNHRTPSWCLEKWRAVWCGGRTKLT